MMMMMMTEINFIAGHGRGDRSPEHESEAAAPAPLTSSPMSPPTAVDVDPIAQRLAVLQKRLDIEMKVGELLSSLCSFQLMVERPGSVQSVCTSVCTTWCLDTCRHSANPCVSSVPGRRHLRLAGRSELDFPHVSLPLTGDGRLPVPVLHLELSA